MAGTPAAPQTDRLAQMFSANLPETALDIRRMLDPFAGVMNGGLPEIGAFHEAVPVREGVTADVMVPHGADPEARDLPRPC
jgi:hypothetical protein